MATITLRTKEIGLDEPLKIKRNAGLKQKTKVLASEVNEWQLKATRAELKALDDDTDEKIAELKNKVAKSNDEVEKIKLNKQIKRLKLNQQIKSLENSDKDLDTLSQMEKDLTEKIIAVLDLDDEQADKVRNNNMSPEKIGSYVGYLTNRFSGMSDSEYDQLVAKNKQQEKLDPKKG